MNGYVEEEMATMTDEQLRGVIEDCQSRISSNMCSGEFNASYVEKQRQIIFSANDELIRRDKI